MVASADLTVESGGNQRRTRLKRRLLALYVAVLIVALLYPFEFRQPVQSHANGVRWLDETNGLDLQGIGIVFSASPAKALRQSILEGAGLTLEAWLSTADIEQIGPARILTYSYDKHLRNFTLGQEGSDLVFRLRTTQTDLNGQRPELVVPGLFSSAKAMHIAITYDFESTVVYVDGEPVHHDHATRGRFTNWDRSFRFALGNEVSGNRPWRGKLFLSAIYSRALDADEILRNHAAGRGSEFGAAVGSRVGRGLVSLYTFDGGPAGKVHDRGGRPEPLDLDIPSDVRVVDRPFLSLPYRYVDPRFLTQKQVRDAVLNVVIFVPLGYLLCGVVLSRGRPPLFVTLLVLVCALTLSVGMEVIQYYFHTRSSSLTDVIHNGVGACLGIAVDLALRRIGS